MSFLLISVVNKLGCESVNVDTILTHKKIFVLALSTRPAASDGWSWPESHQATQSRTRGCEVSARRPPGGVTACSPAW